jgi:hypothetical protein
VEQTSLDGGLVRVSAVTQDRRSIRGARVRELAGQVIRNVAVALAEAPNGVTALTTTE